MIDILKIILTVIVLPIYLIMLLIFFGLLTIAFVTTMLFFTIYVKISEFGEWFSKKVRGKK